METKQELRKYIKALKRSTHKEVLAEQSHDICEAIMADSHVAVAKTLMAFYPLADEPDIAPVLPQLRKAGKRVVLPAVADGRIELRDFDEHEELAEGAYHIKEPQKASAVKPHDIDVILVPGMAFTASGKRLGRGGGYYDRFLPEASKAWKIGIAFPLQLLDDVPTDAYDQCVDRVIVGK